MAYIKQFKLKTLQKLNLWKVALNKILRKAHLEVLFKRILAENKKKTMVVDKDVGQVRVF